jgi:hypothetical protein
MGSQSWWHDRVYPTWDGVRWNLGESACDLHV